MGSHSIEGVLEIEVGIFWRHDIGEEWDLRLP